MGFSDAHRIRQIDPKIFQFLVTLILLAKAGSEIYLALKSVKETNPSGKLTW
jgi:hypothetical protein